MTVLTWWRTRRVGAQLLVGLVFLAAGVAAGQLLGPAKARACSCADPIWALSLTSIENAPEGSDHSGHWPAQGEAEYDFQDGVDLRLSAGGGNGASFTVERD